MFWALQLQMQAKWLSRETRVDPTQDDMQWAVWARSIRADPKTTRLFFFFLIPLLIIGTISHHQS